MENKDSIFTACAEWLESLNPDGPDDLKVSEIPMIAFADTYDKLSELAMMIEANCPPTSDEESAKVLQISGVDKFDRYTQSEERVRALMHEFLTRVSAFEQRLVLYALIVLFIPLIAREVANYIQLEIK
jgi:hypothetical protein